MEEDKDVLMELRVWSPLIISCSFASFPITASDDSGVEKLFEGFEWTLIVKFTYTGDFNGRAGWFQR